MKKLLKQKFQNSQWFAEILIYIFTAECVFGGSGRWLCIGNLSIRICLFLISFVTTLPYVILKKAAILKNKSVVFTILFGFMVLISTIIGITNRNSISFIWADVSGFLTFALLPGIIAVIDTDRKLLRMLDVIFGASVFVAIVTVGLHLGLHFLNGATVNVINNWINSRNLGGLAILTTGIYRVYLRAQIFMQFSIIYGVWKLGNTCGKIKKISIYIVEALLFMADIVSYTRGFWCGLAVSAVLVLALEYKYGKRLLYSAVVIFVIFLLETGISWGCYGHPYLFIEVANRFDSNLVVLSANDETRNDEMVEGTEEYTDGTTDIVNPNNYLAGTSNQGVQKANEDAVTIRRNTLASINNYIAERPIWGWGLGKNLDGVREDGKTEYMYQDIVMKMGIVGTVLLFLAYFFSSGVHIFRRMKRFRDKLEWNNVAVRNTFLTAAYLGVAVTSAFNPFLTCPMGILMVCVINVAVSNEMVLKAENRQS